MSQPVPNPNGRPRLQFSFRALLACVTVLAVVFGISAPQLQRLRRQRLPQTLPVTGAITMDGVPVSGATVTFLPIPWEREGKPASGQSDDKGNFTVRTYFNPKYSPDGALPGDYDVLVTKIEAIPRTTGGGPPWIGKVREWAPKNVLPEKYASFESGLTATIKKGADNKFLFDLKAEP